MLQAVRDALNGIIHNPEEQNWYNPHETITDYDSLPTEVVNKIRFNSKKPANKYNICFPVNICRVTSKYGFRMLLGRRRWHNGTDYTGHNKYCIAPTDVIIKKICKPDYEYPCRFVYNKKLKKYVPSSAPKGRAWTPYIVAESLHDTKVRFYFKHVEPLTKLSVGDILKCGERVASVGNFGYSLGAHLHFEVRLFKFGKWNNTDPHKWIANEAANIKRAMRGLI